MLYHLTLCLIVGKRFDSVIRALEFAKLQLLGIGRIYDSNIETLSLKEFEFDLKTGSTKTVRAAEIKGVTDLRLIIPIITGKGKETPVAAQLTTLENIFW